MVGIPASKLGLYKYMILTQPVTTTRYGAPSVFTENSTATDARGYYQLFVLTSAENYTVAIPAKIKTGTSYSSSMLLFIQNKLLYSKSNSTMAG